MSKLIFCPTSTVLEETYIGIKNGDSSINPLYKSVAFTGDGYMYTHGKKFRLFVVSNQLEGLGFTVEDGQAKFSIDGTVIGSGTVVQQITGDNIVAAQTLSGVTTLTHKQYLNVNDPQSYGSSTKIPTVTVDKYGHITAITENNIDPTKIKASLANSAGTYYITGVTGNSAQNPVYANNLYFDESGNLHAGTIYQGQSPLQNIYAPIAHVNVVADNMTSGHVLLSDLYDINLDDTQGTAATPKAVYNSLEAAKSYTVALAAAQDAMVFAGTITSAGVITSHNVALFTAENDTDTIEDIDYKVGWTFRFSQSGTFNEEPVEVGDMIIAIKAKSSEFDMEDWTIIQTNINGALTSTSNLNGILYANNSRIIQSLALSSGVLTYSNNTLGFVNKNTLWRDILVKDISIGTNSLNFKEGNNVSITDNNGEVTISVSAGNIIAASKTLKIVKDVTEFSYTPNDGNIINLGSHLTIDQDQEENWILNHVTIGTAVQTATLGKITTDAYGHVTSVTEISSLPNAYGLKINNNNGSTLLTYNGESESVIKVLSGTDINLALNVNNGALEITPQITHKYRPVQFYNNTQDPTVSIGAGDNGYLTLIAGDNITLSNKDSNNNDLAAGSIKITAADTWRNIEAYAYRNGSLSRSSIGDSILRFSEDFLISDNELVLSWTEVDELGRITHD